MLKMSEEGILLTIRIWCTECNFLKLLNLCFKLNGFYSHYVIKIRLLYIYIYIFNDLNGAFSMKIRVNQALDLETVCILLNYKAKLIINCIEYNNVVIRPFFSKLYVGCEKLSSYVWVKHDPGCTDD